MGTAFTRIEVCASDQVCVNPVIPYGDIGVTVPRY